MSLVLELDPAIEQRVRLQAALSGVAAEQFVSELVSRAVNDDAEKTRSIDPCYLMNLSVEERGRIMAAAAEDAAELYEADLALPVKDRELTAFTALNDDPLYEYPDDSS